MNYKDILKLDDNSITDYDTIHYIGLLTTDFTNNLTKEERQKLSKKVKSEFMFIGLYPNIMKTYNIKPE